MNEWMSEWMNVRENDIQVWKGSWCGDGQSGDNVNKKGNNLFWREIIEIPSQWCL